MYKNVIFDFFEVIHQDPLAIWLEHHDYERKDGFEEICAQLDLGQIDYATYLERIAALGGQTAGQLIEYFDNLATVDEAMIELIKDLRTGGHRVGLLSNTHQEEIQPLLKRHDLTPLFDEIVISADVGLSKPDPKIFELMLERLGAEPAEAIFTDDNPKNVAGAETTGIKGVHFTTAESLRTELDKLGIKLK